MWDATLSRRKKTPDDKTQEIVLTDDDDACIIAHAVRIPVACVPSRDETCGCCSDLIDISFCTKGEAAHFVIPDEISAVDVRCSSTRCQGR